ncbi:peptidoglycan editing factor PgeF [Jeotgalibaca caeni]|uniref:peptidoglycan editing factor PgeF n=1 Tax=Jeotgalibaca caeni TaxID=3028623 RepID=UPI00237DB77E|nr:peptidoglycan editing factor PgeF [Jeotgalibaca caeni]MDE1549190.1 peptidoglycan editing factor PgeF [Jeotgalibaca caeni]
MHSSLLAKNGLKNKIAGADYNFRYQMVGDRIEEDMIRFLSEMNIKPLEIYSGQQVHGAQIGYADGTSGEEFVFGRIFQETDGLITDQPGISLFIKYADCTPIVLFDPVKKIQAMVHSGWRGTVQRISEQAVEQMERDFHCSRENILAYVGPSIAMEHYEVGSEVYEAFAAFPNRDDFFKPHGEKYLLSMTDANLAIIREAGIKENNIEVERISTFSTPTLHSARREGKEYGLNGLLTMME